MSQEAQKYVPGDVFERMVAVRRDLHKHPELSLNEERTGRQIAAELDRLGIVYKAGVGGHGVVADIPGKQPGPIVALRADMDALPIHEETGLPFTSVHDGVMHACGHDGHSSMLVGAAELLTKNGTPPLPVRLIWEPAEEEGDGARSMIEAGVLEGVDSIFGCHVDRHYLPGTLVVTEGAVNAAADAFRIEIHGTQGHGARPHEALDAVVVGSLLVMAIQTIVSREVDPAHPSVLSVGKFTAGTASNVIAGSACLEGTIRTHDASVREHLASALKRIGTAVGQLHGADIKVVIERGLPPVVNTPEMVSLAQQAAEGVVGPDNVQPLRTTNMGAEDFALFLEHVSGCYIRVGSQVQGKEGFPAHSSQFDFDEIALASGAAWLARVAHVAGESRLSLGQSRQVG